MTAFPATVDRLLERCTFPSPGEPVTCAVSGGADSMALLVLAAAAGCSVTAVHVDHGLRPGSGAEAELVAAAAARVGASFRAARVDVAAGPNLEARARAARYGVLPPDVATGHTMDDQAETVLCNLLRGSGPDGLAAMRAGHHHPLLGLRRAETAEVCKVMELRPFADPSNESQRFLRNRVREELLPLCAEVAGRDPVPLLARFASLAAEDAVLLDELARAALPDPGAAAAIAAAPPPLAARALRQWLRAAGATPPMGGRTGLPDPGARHRGTDRDRCLPDPVGGTDPGADPDTGASLPDALSDRYPPPLADVRRVLGVARGDAVATELAGGWRVRRSGGRLYAEPPAPSAPAGAPPAPPGGPVAPSQ